MYELVEPQRRTTEKVSYTDEEMRCAPRRIYQNVGQLITVSSVGPGPYQKTKNEKIKKSIVPLI